MNNSHSAKGNLESRLGAVLRDVQDRLRALERRRHTDTVTVVESGSNTTVTGTGSASDPYVVNAEAAYTDEQVRDVIGAALVAGTGMTVTVDDVGNTITLDSASGYTDEQVRDVIGAALVAGTGMTVTVNDAGDTITFDSTGGYTDEQVRDVIGAALVAGTNVTITVNDAGDTITIDATGGGSSGNAPDGKPLLHTPPASPNAKDDEFNDDTSMSGPVNGLDAKWSLRNMGTPAWSVLDDSKAPGCFMFDIPSGQTTSQGIYQAVPAGDFRVVARMLFGSASDRQMWGPFILDTSGNGVAICLDDPVGDGTTYLRSVTAWAQAGTLATLPPGVNAAWTQGWGLTLSLRKASGVYHAGLSFGDRILPGGFKEVNGTPSAFTAAYVGVGRLYTAGSGSSQVALDYFRIT